MSGYGYVEGGASTESSPEKVAQKLHEASSSSWLLREQQQDSFDRNNQLQLQFDAETRTRINGFGVAHPHSSSSGFRNLYLGPDSLPPSDSLFGDVAMEDMKGKSFPLLFPSSSGALWIGETGPREHNHRRFNSDFSYGYFPELQALSENQITSTCQFDRSFVDGESSLLKRDSYQGEEWAPGRHGEDLTAFYMNSENPHNFLGNSLKGKEDEMKINGRSFSENDETSGSESTMKISEGVRRNGTRGMASKGKHRHSLSVDGSQRNAYFGAESPQMALPQGMLFRQGAAANTVEASGRSTETESSDSKRATRIMANRQSAARSKERKMRYMADLESKVRALQAEATSLCAQLTVLQRETIELSNHNNELKYRLQAMQQHAQLQDALHSALSTEVQRLKLETMEVTRESSEFHLVMMSLQASPVREERQPSELNIDQEHQNDEYQQSQVSKGSASATNDPK